MPKGGRDYIFRKPFSSPSEAGATSPVYRRTVENGMIIEKDVSVKMRDNVEIFIDVFRPADEVPAAPVIGWSPYGKHGTINYYGFFPGCGVTPEQNSRHAAFEALDPAYWVPRGYAIIKADIRGTWNSEGNATFCSPEEADDYYDLIEWAGTRPWSNGKVGLSGVSYLATSQWGAAGTHPPHLAAINPWEGFSDIYREVIFHGGIPETGFWPMLPGLWGAGTGKLEDLAAEVREHPFFDALWASKAPDMSRIEVPAFVVASWSDQGLHTRGTLEGFKRMKSEHKWLEVHGRKKWQYYYEPGSVQRLQSFFDHFLKGMVTDVLDWPKVRVEHRERFFQGQMVEENEWPIARTRYTKFHLDANSGSMQQAPISTEGSCQYSARAEGREPSRATFDITFDKPTSLVGHMKLKLWAQAEGADGPFRRRPETEHGRRGGTVRFLGAVRRWPGGARLAPRLSSRARSATVDRISAGAGASARTEAEAGRDRGPGNRDLAIRHPIRRRGKPACSDSGHGRLQVSQHRDCQPS